MVTSLVLGAASAKLRSRLLRGCRVRGNGAVRSIRRVARPRRRQRAGSALSVGEDADDIGCGDGSPGSARSWGCWTRSAARPLSGTRRRPECRRRWRRGRGRRLASYCQSVEHPAELGMHRVGVGLVADRVQHPLPQPPGAFFGVAAIMFAAYWVLHRYQLRPGGVAPIASTRPRCASEVVLVGSCESQLPILLPRSRSSPA